MCACLRCRCIEPGEGGVSEILTFTDTPAGLGDFKALLLPKRTLSCWAALVNWHSCLGPSPLFPVTATTSIVNSHRERSFTQNLEWVERQKLRLFLLLLSRSFSGCFTSPFMFHSFQWPKAMWLNPATPVRHPRSLHKLLGMSDLFVMS